MMKVTKKCLFWLAGLFRFPGLPGLVIGGAVRRLIGSAMLLVFAGLLVLYCGEIEITRTIRYLNLDKTEEEVGSDTTSTDVSFTVKEGWSWTAESDEVWCRPDPDSGTSTGDREKVVVELAKSFITNERECVITFTIEGDGSEESSTFTVIQEGNDEGCDPNSPDLKRSGTGEAPYWVCSADQLRAISNLAADYLLVADIVWENSGDGFRIGATCGSGTTFTGSFTSSGIENEEGVYRISNSARGFGVGDVFGCPNDGTIEVTLFKSTAEPYISVSSEITTSFSSGGGTGTIEVSSNVSWTASVVTSDGGAWCTLDTDSGAGDATVTATVLENTTVGTASRSCTLTFTADGDSAVFTVVQQETPPCPLSSNTGGLVDYTINGVSFLMCEVPVPDGGLSFPTETSDMGDTGVVESGYYIAQTEVTYELWAAVYNWATQDGCQCVGGRAATVDSSCQPTGENCYCFDNEGTEGDNGSRGDQHPVTTVNWYDAVKFSNALTEYYNATNGTEADLSLVYGLTTEDQQAIRTVVDVMDSDDHILNSVGTEQLVNADATGFRLPSDAEWELAARFIANTGDTGVLEMGEYYCGSCPSGSTIPYDDTVNNENGAAVAWYDGNADSSTQPVSG